jgi:hypothetical protein
VSTEAANATGTIVRQQPRGRPLVEFGGRGGAWSVARRAAHAALAGSGTLEERSSALMSQFEDSLWRSVVDRHGDDLARADALVARRARPTRPRLLAGATAAVGALAAAVTLLLSATASPPAFAVTRLHDGSASLQINRTSSIADVNRKLAAMGIRKIDKRAIAAGDPSSSIPSCSSIPPGWKGEWVQIAGAPTAYNTSSGGNFAPGTWHLVICTPDSLG